MPHLRLTQQVAEAFLPNPPEILGVAVSGGSDSMALLHLMHGFCALHGCKLRAVTVDHGLRPEAKDEAEAVRQVCAQLGVAHDTLLWTGWDGVGNLQSAAREARYGLMTQWAADNDISTIAIGHTADDQAETFLMRLVRRSGVDGLSGIPHRVMRDGVTWVRPLLSAGREVLRSYLRTQRILWIDDPSNDDTQFERVRTRQALTQLSTLGIDVQVLSEVAGHMSQARRALDWQTFIAARDIAHIDAGAVVLCERRLRILPDEIQRRLIVQAINWISGKEYPARRAAIANLMQAIRKGQAGTADGVHLRRVAGQIWVFREWNAVRDISCKPDALWDARWRMRPGSNVPLADDLVVRALGECGLQQCETWRDTGRPHDVLVSTPAIWRGDDVVAAPLAGWGDPWHAEVNGGQETFFAALLTQ